MQEAFWNAASRSSANSSGLQYFCTGMFVFVGWRYWPMFTMSHPRPKVIEGLQDLVPCLPETEHDAGFTTVPRSSSRAMRRNSRERS